MHIVLLEPEIPQNTGNIARLASAVGAELWLVGRLGFSLSDKHTKRAGMDYWDKVEVRRIPTLTEFYPMINDSFAFISTKGSQLYTAMPDNTDTLVFGCESSGLPGIIYKKYPEMLYRIPMIEGIRSLNISSSAAVAVYHLACRWGFDGLI